jgi:tRNA-splicing ligase RtcB
MQVIEGRKGGLIKAWTDGVPVEDDAWDQIHNVASLPYVHGWVAVMPDVHYGMGATIGTVVATRDAIIPAAVGVDIGCGMMAVRTTARLSDLPPPADMRRAIEEAVPHGRSHNGGPGDVGAWRDIPGEVQAAWSDELRAEYETLDVEHTGREVSQLGTLGTGNHFIEVDVDAPDGFVWVMLHSGSRGIGNRIGTSYMKAAIEARKGERLPDKNLAFFTEDEPAFARYLRAAEWAQRYAKVNRSLMMRRALNAIGADVWIECIDCHHNFVQGENHEGVEVLVTRKGATRAGRGDMVIIPGAMGRQSYICTGRGNPESFNSCSHGAGRAMSRRAAVRKFTVADHEAATNGVECKKGKDVLDETPGAYKDIDAVMAAQTDLVSIVETLRPVVVVKG